jgi:hypothetical protein
MQTFTKHLVALGLLSFGLPVAVSAQTILGFLPAQAAPGTTVTITGTGLNNLRSVTLNGQPMKVTANSAISVSVIVPQAAATGRMRLTTSNGSALTANKLGIQRQSSAVSYGFKTLGTINTPASGKYSTPTIGDFDQDDQLELLVGQGDGTIIDYEQTAVKSTDFTSAGTLLKVLNSNGTQSTLNVGVNNSGGQFAKPTVVDLDGDGLLELLVGENTGTVLRYEQVDAKNNALVFTRSLLFNNPYASTTNPSDGNYARPTVADMDNDGLLDVLVGSNDGKLHRYEQKTPNAAAMADFNVVGLMKDDKGVVIDAGAVDKPLLTDYNGDGYLDMLLGNQAGTIVLYTQTGSDAVTFKSLGTLTTDGTNALSMAGITNGGYAAPAVTDLDGNGLLDLYVGNGSGTIYRYEQTQSATAPIIVAPLPVVLVSFTGQAQSTGSQLAWATASELNSAYFAVERSADGQAFSQVAQVAAAGNCATARTYAYLDATAPAGTSYYRLRQVDQDGTVAYSPVVVLSRAVALGEAKPQVYPTVFDAELHVALPGTSAPQPATVALLAADGRPVYSQALQLGSTPQTLAALPTLAPGVYLLRVATAAGASTQRVVRQ